MAPVTNREVSIRTMWQLEVREGVFIHPAADIVQEMSNKGYDVATAEKLAAEGHQFYKEGRLDVCLHCAADTCVEEFERMRISELTERTFNLRNKLFG
jgi:hypothetical protein